MEVNTNNMFGFCLEIFGNYNEGLSCRSFRQYVTDNNVHEEITEVDWVNEVIVMYMDFQRELDKVQHNGFDIKIETNGIKCRGAAHPVKHHNTVKLEINAGFILAKMRKQVLNGWIQLIKLDGVKI